MALTGGHRTEVTVQIRSKTQRMKAATTTPEKRAELWSRLVEIQGVGRLPEEDQPGIPVVILSPA